MLALFFVGGGLRPVFRRRIRSVCDFFFVEKVRPAISARESVCDSYRILKSQFTIGIVM